MRGQVKIGSGIKIRKSATTKDNTEVKDTLRQIKLAIQEGKLDSIFSLKTYDIIPNSENENGVLKTIDRNMTMTELNQHIDKNRLEKIDDIDFALYQMSLFSKYLKKNVHASSNGYSASMILNFIPSVELRKLIDIILDEKQKIESSDFVESKYNNQHGSLETLRDRLHTTLSNNYENKLEDQR